MSLSQPSVGEVGVIALSPDPWSAQWMDRHYLLSRLAGHFQVVWMTQPRWRQSLAGLGSRGVSPAADAARPAGLQVYEPEAWLPRVGRPGWLARFTSRERLRRANALLRARGCTKVVLFICQPEYGVALEDIHHDFSIYYVSDEYSFTTTEVELSATERKVLGSVDQVYLTSPALMQKRGSFNPNTEFLPMGVDYQKFSTPVPEPDDLRGIPYPRVGYMGHLKRMLDWPLLLDLSTAHPEWSFVFVGPKGPHPDIDALLGKMSLLPNVHFLGGKPTKSLGAYPQHFDVCLMPYVIDDYTRYVYPLKMHEYLAGGKPVVSSPIRSVEDFKHVIALARTREEWSRAIQDALSAGENTPEQRVRRQRVARDYDWDGLVAKLVRAITSGLGMNVPPDAVIPTFEKSYEVSPANR
jgi:glycosyltransferase involved in cell wall biosynthesis